MFTVLPAHRQDTFFGELDGIREFLNSHKCKYVVPLFGKAYYENAWGALVAERMRGVWMPKKQFRGHHLYHYTSLQVLKTLRDPQADLACTRFSMLNDTEEFRRGFYEMLKVLGDDKEMRLSNAHRKWLSDYFESQIVDGIHGAWIMSFSELNDDLYQWSAYTDRKNGGCAIAFDLRELNRIVRLYRADEKSQFDVYLLPCVYYIGNFTSTVFMSLFHVKDKLRDFSQQDSNAFIRLTPPDVLGEAWDALIMVASLLKHHCFAWEREWRLLMIPKWNIQASDFPSSNLVAGKLRYFIHQASSRNRKHYTPKCIRGIMLSPHGNKDFNRTIATEIVGSNNDPNCRIIESTLPYNGK